MHQTRTLFLYGSRILQCKEITNKTVKKEHGSGVNHARSWIQKNPEQRQKQGRTQRAESCGSSPWWAASTPDPCRLSRSVAREVGGRRWCPPLELPPPPDPLDLLPSCWAATSRGPPALDRVGTELGLDGEELPNGGCSVFGRISGWRPQIGAPPPEIAAPRIPLLPVSPSRGYRRQRSRRWGPSGGGGRRRGGGGMGCRRRRREERWTRG